MTPVPDGRQAARSPAGHPAAERRLTVSIDAAEASFFVPLFEPFLLRASQRLADRLDQLDTGSGERLFDIEAVHAQLLRPLVALAQTLPARTLTLELNIARLDGALPGADSEARFAAFVKRLSDPGTRRELLGRYPVLVRQFTIAVRQWLRTTAQLMERIVGDRDELRERFGATGPVTAIRLGLGDRHRGGATVAEVSWAGGTRLIYKPRPMAVDVHFGDLLAWLNARGLSTPLRSTQTLDRGEYGWARFVEAAPCDGLDGVHRFYRRQGCLLALLYLLHANDLHAENLIAAGEHPVLVDLESLIQPALPLYDPAQTPAELAAAEAVENSVLAAGLLPAPVWDAESASVTDLSGLGASASQLTPIAMPFLADRGSDTMRVGLQRKEAEQTAHRPVDASVELSLPEFADDLVAGFTELYQLSLRNREALAAGPLAAFAGDEVRVVLRATMIYSTILQTGFHPSLLGDRSARDNHFDALWRDVPRLPALEYVIPAERRDLWRNDIPMFTIATDGEVLRDSDGRPVPGITVQPGLDRVRLRLAGLTEAEQARQTQLIRGAMGTSTLDTTEQLTMGRYRHVPVERPDTPGDLLATADRIGHYLTRISYQEGGTAQWLGVNANQGMHWSLGPLWPDLFHGLAGIALFLGCLGELTGDRAHTDLARSALATVREQVARGLLADEAGMAGIPGVLYASGWLAHLWRTDEPLRDSGEWLAAIAAGIPADTEYDLVGGSAGTIACLLAVHRLTPASELTGTIARAARHLQANAQRFPRGLGWLSPTVASLWRANLPLASLSHGLAGIAWPLFEAAELLDDAELADTARAAIDYEQALFEPETGGWRDLRDLAAAGAADDLPPAAFWCYGATGIGLGRVLCRTHLAGDQVAEQEIATAVATTVQYGFGNTHSLCHGDLGNLELLQLTGHPRTEILARAAAIQENISTSGWLCGTPQAVDTPGLMTGIAGIGYGLLRAAQPDRVPCVLVLG